MKNPKISSEGKNYTALDLGEFSDLIDYSFLHPRLKSEIKGKVFIGEILNATGTEISFQVLLPDTSIPFLHQHKNHEEVYIVLKGTGLFQVDGSIFKIKQGSIIRIAPEGKRSFRNNSDKPMIIMCIQVHRDSLECFQVFDGFRTQGEIPWSDNSSN
jgi:mannose-6-phosphate isomerase-like protein (cupin superfamily)